MHLREVQPQKLGKRLLKIFCLFAYDFFIVYLTFEQAQYVDQQFRCNVFFRSKLKKKLNQNLIKSLYTITKWYKSLWGVSKEKRHWCDYKNKICISVGNIYSILLLYKKFVNQITCRYVALFFWMFGKRRPGIGSTSQCRKWQH